jgi:hypothetical protein
MRAAFNAIKTYLMLRSARPSTPPCDGAQDEGARLEARTALMQLTFSASIDFLKASRAEVQSGPLEPWIPGFPLLRLSGNPARYSLASCFVVPAKAGTQGFQSLALGPRFRGGDDWRSLPI